MYNTSNNQLLMNNLRDFLHMVKSPMVITFKMMTMAVYWKHYLNLGIIHKTNITINILLFKFTLFQLLTIKLKTRPNLINLINLHKDGYNIIKNGLYLFLIYNQIGN